MGGGGGGGRDILDGEGCENPEDGQGFREDDDEELFEEAPYQQGELDGRIDIVQEQDATNGVQKLVPHARVSS